MSKDSNQHGGGWIPMTRTTWDGCEAVSDTESNQSAAFLPIMGTNCSAMPTGQSTTTSARDIPKGSLFPAGAYARMMAESDSDSEDDYVTSIPNSDLFRPVPKKAIPRHSPNILKASSLTKVFPGVFDGLPDSAMNAVIETCKLHRCDTYESSSASDIEESSELEEDGNDEEDDEENDMDLDSDSGSMADGDGKDDGDSDDSGHVQKQDVAHATAHRE